MTWIRQHGISLVVAMFSFVATVVAVAITWGTLSADVSHISGQVNLKASEITVRHIEKDLDATTAQVDRNRNDISELRSSMARAEEAAKRSAAASERIEQLLLKGTP